MVRSPKINFPRLLTSSRGFWEGIIFWAYHFLALFDDWLTKRAIENLRKRILCPRIYIHSLIKPEPSKIEKVRCNWTKRSNTSTRVLHVHSRLPSESIFFSFFCFTLDPGWYIDVIYIHPTQPSY